MKCYKILCLNWLETPLLRFWLLSLRNIAHFQVLIFSLKWFVFISQIYRSIWIFPIRDVTQALTVYMYLSLMWKDCNGSQSKEHAPHFHMQWHSIRNTYFQVRCIFALKKVKTTPRQLFQSGVTTLARGSTAIKTLPRWILRGLALDTSYTLEWIQCSHV